MAVTAPEIRVRQARADDHEDVAAFTRDTWGGERGDYIPRVFEDWVAGDGPDQRTFVADVNGGEDVAGLCQGVLLSDWEAWGQGMRVNPEYRGRGVSRRLTAAMFEWARERGAAVARNMVFSWNVAGLGQARSVGFDPCTEFRFANPEPDPDAVSGSDPAADVDPAGATPSIAAALADETLRGGVELRTGDAADPDDAWSLWADSAAREHLAGLALDDEESWALSELTRERLRTAAADDRLLTVREGGVAGFTYRDRTVERETDDGEVETRAVYGVAAWESLAAARALYRGIARDAAAAAADSTRVLIPETVETVSDTAAARVEVADEPDFVMAADLTGPAVARVDG